MEISYVWRAIQRLYYTKTIALSSPIKIFIIKEDILKICQGNSLDPFSDPKIDWVFQQTYGKYIII